MSLFNPDLKDFVFFYNKTVDPTEYRIPAYDFAVFPKYIADVAASQLADRLLQKRGIKTNYQDEKQKLLKEIYLKNG